MKFISNIVKIASFATALASAPLAYSAPGPEYTGYSTISSIEYDATAERMFIRNNNGTAWEVTGCATATYVVIQPGVQGRKELLSLALAAKMAGTTVRFYGTCNTGNSKHFDATWIHLV